MTQIKDQLKQLRVKSSAQLIMEERELRKELANLRISLNMGRLKDISKIKKAKKKLARILTILNEKHIADS